MDCSFECSAAVEVNDSGVAPHLYRIAQEALHNAAKHSGGAKIVIRLVQEGWGIALSVEDDGVGFNPDAAHWDGLGLHTMTYRARAIGATLSFSRSEMGGTKVLCTLPASKP